MSVMRGDFAASVVIIRSRDGLGGAYVRGTSAEQILRAIGVEPQWWATRACFLLPDSRVDEFLEAASRLKVDVTESWL